jgi:hypothetical protein
MSSSRVAPSIRSAQRDYAGSDRRPLPQRRTPASRPSLLARIPELRP